MNEVKEREVIDLTEEASAQKVMPAAPQKKVKNVNAVNAIPRSFRMMRSIAQGEYKAIPVATIIAVLIGIAYIVLPADMIPDMIPFFGYVDDVSILALCLTLAQRDISAYEIWKDSQNCTN